MIKHPHRLALATLVIALASSSMAAHAALIGGAGGGALGGGIGPVGGSLGGAFGGQGQWQGPSPRPAVHAVKEDAPSRTSQVSDQAMQRKDNAAAAASRKASRAEGVAQQGLNQTRDAKGEATAATTAAGDADSNDSLPRISRSVSANGGAAGEGQLQAGRHASADGQAAADAQATRGNGSAAGAQAGGSGSVQR